VVVQIFDLGYFGHGQRAAVIVAIEFTVLKDRAIFDEPIEPAVDILSGQVEHERIGSSEDEPTSDTE
jgi:hypothetical protein